jgi:malonate transporter and related proteins
VGEILNLAVPFFSLIALGVLASRLWSVGEDGLQWVNIFLVYFSLPSLIYLVIAAAPFEKLIDWPFVTATSSVTAACFLLMVLASRCLFSTALKTAALQGTAASYGNVGYMGLPLAVAFFGPEAAIPAALVFCFDCAVQFILTAFIATYAEGRGAKLPLLQLIKKILWQVCSHPFNIATALGMFASATKFSLPDPVTTTMEMLSRAAGPCALFALGVTVGLRKFSGVSRELPIVVGIKTILQPLLAIAVVGLLPGVDPLWLHVAMMMAALPTASNAFILARQYNSYIDGASTAVIVTTVITAFTIPFLVYAAKSGLI